MKALLNVETYDHPIVFLLFLALAIIPVLYVVYCLAAKVGISLPAVGAAA